ncbi:MAG: acyltransferase [Rhodothermales bacterium]
MISISSHIAPSVHLGSDCTIGHFCVIEEGVHIGPGCQIGHHVVIRAGARIGDNVRIDDHASIGKQPMRAANSAVTQEQTLPPTSIGNRCIIGTGVVVYSGCTLGEKVLVADLATVRENVTVGDFTIIGRGVAVENYCTIGRYCKLETNAYLTAYSTLEDRVFVAPGVLTSNDNFMGRTAERFDHFKGVTVRRGGRLGVGAVVLPGKEIAPDGVVAAGALLTKSITEAEIHAGFPARAFRSVPNEQLLDKQGWDD